MTNKLYDHLTGFKLLALVSGVGPESYAFKFHRNRVVRDLKLRRTV